MNHVNNSTGVSPAKNLLDTVAADPSYSTFAAVVAKADLGATLSGLGPYTVFAPTNAAFEQLPAGQLDSLFKPENRQELVALVNYHVIKGRKKVADIGKWPTANMANGQTATVTLENGRIMIGGAQVIDADIATSNGLMHGIDKVNLPGTTRH